MPSTSEAPISTEAVVESMLGLHNNDIIVRFNRDNNKKEKKRKRRKRERTKSEKRGRDKKDLR